MLGLFCGSRIFWRCPSMLASKSLEKTIKALSDPSWSQKTYALLDFHTFLYVFHMFLYVLYGLQDAPSWEQVGAKLGTVGAMLVDLGPMWPHLTPG